MIDSLSLSHALHKIRLFFPSCSDVQLWNLSAGVTASVLFLEKEFFSGLLVNSFLPFMFQHDAGLNLYNITQAAAGVPPEPNYKCGMLFLFPCGREKTHSGWLKWSHMPKVAMLSHVRQDSAHCFYKQFWWMCLHYQTYLFINAFVVRKILSYLSLSFQGKG